MTRLASLSLATLVTLGGTALAGGPADPPKKPVTSAAAYNNAKGAGVRGSAEAPGPGWEMELHYSGRNPTTGETVQGQASSTPRGTSASSGYQAGSEQLVDFDVPVYYVDFDGVYLTSGGEYMLAGFIRERVPLGSKKFYTQQYKNEGRYEVWSQGPGFAS